jgi:hypothetical protein
MSFSKYIFVLITGLGAQSVLLAQLDNSPFYQKDTIRAEKNELYKKWVTAEQINSHIVKHEDGSETDMGVPEGIE